MLSTYTDAIETTLLVLAGTAGALTVLLPFALAGGLLRPRVRRLRWHLDARTYRARRP